MTFNLNPPTLRAQQQATLYDAYKQSDEYAWASTRGLTRKYKSIDEVPESDKAQYIKDKTTLERTPEQVASMTPEEARQMDSGRFGGGKSNFSSSMDTYRTRMGIMDTGGKTIASTTVRSDACVARLANIQASYDTTVSNGSVIDQVIASGGKGVTDAQLKVLRQVTGNSHISRNNENFSASYVLDQAQKAKTINTQQQNTLMQQASAVQAEHQQATQDAKVIADAITKALGGKPAPASTPTAGNNTNTTIINNNTNEGGGTSSGVAGMHTANPNDSSGGTIEPNNYEKMQTQGIKIIEQMLRQMRVENADLHADVDKINTKLDK